MATLRNPRRGRTFETDHNFAISSRSGAPRRSLFLSTLLGFLAAALLFGTVPAVAGAGDTFLLGRDNHAGTKSTMFTAKVGDGPALKIDNPAGGGRAPLRLDSAGPPLATNSTKKVKNLNVDSLDGHDSSDFHQDCQAGTVAAYVQVDAEPGLAWSVQDGWSCNGSPVHARKEISGVYVVRFGGFDFRDDESGLVVNGTAVNDGIGASLTYSSSGGDTIRVVNRTHEGTVKSVPFSLSVISTG